ncbi:MAG: type II toxin-antitoxin system HicA family toxin [Thaumarchaeota archaeon]|nr:type II toxin-antitoxin system HicA family toxin [Nitrososphaerota archaeon]
MARLRPLPRRRVTEILKANGFEEVRSGKHITFKKKTGTRALTTWVPHHSEVTVFVIQYIIRQTEKQRSEFE